MSVDLAGTTERTSRTLTSSAADNPYRRAVDAGFDAMLASINASDEPQTYEEMRPHFGHGLAAALPVVLSNSTTSVRLASERSARLREQKEELRELYEELADADHRSRGALEHLRLTLAALLELPGVPPDEQLLVGVRDRLRGSPGQGPPVGVRSDSTP